MKRRGRQGYLGHRVLGSGKSKKAQRPEAKKLSTLDTVMKGGSDIEKQRRLLKVSQRSRKRAAFNLNDEDDDVITLQSGLAASEATTANIHSIRDDFDDAELISKDTRESEKQMPRELTALQFSDGVSKNVPSTRREAFKKLVEKFKTIKAEAHRDKLMQEKLLDKLNAMTMEIKDDLNFAPPRHTEAHSEYMKQQDILNSLRDERSTQEKHILNDFDNMIKLLKHQGTIQPTTRAKSELEKAYERELLEAQMNKKRSALEARETLKLKRLEEATIQETESDDEKKTSFGSQTNTQKSQEPDSQSDSVDSEEDSESDYSEC